MSYQESRMRRAVVLVERVQELDDLASLYAPYELGL